jgi:NADH-quinone oxidoreductase subunit M
MLERVFLGPLNPKYESLPDMNPRELVAVVPLAALTIVLGVWPRLALDLMNPTLSYMARMFPDMFAFLR